MTGLVRLPVARPSLAPIVDADSGSDVSTSSSSTLGPWGPGALGPWGPGGHCKVSHSQVLSQGLTRSEMVSHNIFKIICQTISDLVEPCETPESVIQSG